MNITVDTAVIERIAEHEGTTPAELDFTLYEFLDPDALRNLADNSSSNWELTAEVSEYEVRVTAEEEVEIEELDSQS